MERLFNATLLMVKSAGSLPMRTLSPPALFALALVVLSAEAASTQTPRSTPTLEVAQGCDLPRSLAGGRKFFVDPARGAKENDGSEQRPWRTLPEVLDPANHLVATKAYGRTKDALGPPAPINPAGPIRPGDTIVLMSGDHGSVEVKQYVNDDFIAVVAGKDQTPLVRSLQIIASSHWLFRGIKFQGIRPEGDKYRPMVGLVSHQWLGPTSDIVFVDNSFSTEDSSAGWSPTDWVARPYSYAFASGARCTTALNNHFFNVRNAIVVRGEQSLIEGNLIEDMGNDGVDIEAGGVVVRGNRIRSGRHTPAEPLHADGIQGYVPAGATVRNVVIDSNSVINLNPAEDNRLQGITIFDGRWDGLRVVNNVVITNDYHGMSFYGVDNALVVNNTVVPTRPNRFPAWLAIHDAKDGRRSQIVIVRNNIASQFSIEGKDVVFDHNIAENKFTYRVDGRTASISKGRIGDYNIIDPGIFHTLVNVDLRTGKLDLRPSVRSPAAGAGAADHAPTVDIAGRERSAPIDIGAFAR
jgi:hypothetical protein